jgi:hypothetical protein
MFRRKSGKLARARADGKYADPDLILRRRMYVSEEYCKGRTYAEIRDLVAVQFGVKLDLTSIFCDMQEVRKLWRTRISDGYQTLVNRELARLDHLECVGWDALENSFKEHTSETAKTSRIMVDAALAKQIIRSKGGHKASRAMKGLAIKLPADKHEVTIMHEKTTGDPRWAAIIADCIRQRRELLGLDKPKVIEVREPAVENMTDEELALRVVRGAQRLGQKALPMTIDVKAGKFGPN